MTTAKTDARSKLLRDRKAMPENERASADRETWNALWAFLDEALPDGGTVAAHRPFGVEPGASLRPELPERLAERYTVLLPVTLGDNDLDWIEPGAEPPEHANASEPWRSVALTGPRGTVGTAATRGVEAIARAGAVIVPALAVSTSGTRLGRGGGSYDRALGRVAPEVPVVALLRRGEFGTEPPTEAHDRSVSAVITPDAGYQRIG